MQTKLSYPTLLPIRTMGTLHLPVGQSLLMFLNDELNAIRFENENVIFSLLLLPSKETALQMCMRLMGKIAEAAFVQRCVDSREANQKWLEIAGVKVCLKNVDLYIPIGTGLSKTKKDYYKYYYPNHPQLDIMWIDKSTGNAVLKDYHVSPIPSGDFVGLQIKTRTNASSVYDDLKDGKYYVPIVYFDLSNDYTALVDKIEKKLNVSDGIEIISSKSVDEILYNQVAEMAYVLLNIIDGNVNPNILLNEKKLLEFINVGAKKEILDYNGFDSIFIP